METPKTTIKKLRVELRYFQMQTRLDLRNLEASKRKCREIGQKMREAQKQGISARTGKPTRKP